MRIKKLVIQDVKVSAIRVVLPVQYEEEDIPNDAPLRTGDLWQATIDIDSGNIRDWPIGQTLDMHMKVTDCGSYYLLDADGKEIAKREQDYVPSCIPGSYGDYVEFDISADGTIANWKFKCDAGSVQESFCRLED